MDRAHKLAIELNVSSIEIISAMLELGIPVQFPDLALSARDAKRIRSHFKKTSSVVTKKLAFLISVIVSLTAFVGINNESVFADDTSVPTPLIATPLTISIDSTVSKPTVDNFTLVFMENDCNAIDYSTTDFLVVENIKEFLSQEGYYSGSIDDVFDTKLKLSVQDFQRDMGIRIDGIVGPTTHKMMQNYDSCSKTSIVKLISCYGGDYKAYLACTSPYGASGVGASTTSSQDTEPPQWAEDPLTIINVNSNWALPSVMRATILWGHVTDNVGIDEFQIYVDGELNTTIPGKNCKTKCSSQSSGVNARITDLIRNNYHTIEVRACDEAGNCSTNNPTMTKQFKKTTQVSTTTTTTTTTTTIPGTPSITITAAEVSDGDTSSDSSLSLTFTTSASTTDFAAGDVSVSGGTLSNFAGSGTTYTATFTPTAIGATTIDVAANTFTNTATGTNNTAATQFNWTYSTAPTITITAAEVDDGDSSADTSLSVTFTASQSTTNFAAGDVVVSGGTLSNFSGSGTTYTATFTPSAAGATTIDVAGGTFTNAFSTNNTAATQFNWTYVVSTKLADCGNSSTNANRWVVAVIDEDDSQNNTSMTNQWTSFRSSYPDRCFHLLEPYPDQNSYTTYSTPNGVNSAIKIPTAFINEFSAGTTFHARVSRNSNSYVSGTSDWWDLIGASVLPSGAKIGLCIDNSGSMTVNTVQASLDLFEQKAAAAGVTITPGSGATNSNYYCSGMNSEEWISGLRVDIN